MSKLPTVTIGIPAYNEEANIANLIQALLVQKAVAYRLAKIIVVSDCSIDRTDQIVKSISNSKLVLLRNSKRIGLARTQNRIIKLTNSDFLVLINADVLPANRQFINYLVQPFLTNPNQGLVGAKVVPMPSKSFIESVINYSHRLKYRLYEQLPSDNQIYLCHGRARAFSRIFYKRLNFPGVAAEDAYSYLACLNQGLKFNYQPLAVVQFRAPSNIQDHLKQSARFLQGKTALNKLFPSLNVQQMFTIPVLQLMKIVIVSLISQPIKTITYGVLHMLSRISAILKTNSQNGIWDASVSSKKL